MNVENLGDGTARNRGHMRNGRSAEHVDLGQYQCSGSIKRVRHEVEQRTAQRDELENLIEFEAQEAKFGSARSSTCVMILGVVIGGSMGFHDFSTAVFYVVVCVLKMAIA